MAEKPKFKPCLTRIKLNPEQAVLACLCYDRGFYASRTSIRTAICSGRIDRTRRTYGSSAASTTKS